MRPLVAAVLLACAASSALAADHIVRTIPGPDGIWDYASYDRDTNRVFVAHGDTIGFVDVARPDRVQTLGPARHAHQVLPLPGRNELLVTDGDTASARIVDSRSGAVRAMVKLADKPDAAIWDAKRQRAVVMNNKAGSIMLVDVAAAAVTATITSVKGLEYAAFDADGLLYVNNEETNDIVVVDVDKASIVGKIALPGCEGPTGMAWAPKAKRIVSSCDGLATLVDPATRKVTGTIKIGGGPDAVIPDPARDRLYIPAGDDGTLAVLADRPGGVALTTTVPTAKGARTGAVDPNTGLVYLPTADLIAAKGGGKPTRKDGTFRVVVVKP